MRLALNVPVKLNSAIDNSIVLYLSCLFLLRYQVTAGRLILNTNGD